VAQKQLIYKGNTFNISYEILNHNLANDVVILHGWGSSKALMKSAFGSHLKEFRHIYIDLVGFGNSTSDVVLDSYDYAKIMELFLNSIGAKKDIIIGHSFGGKVATLLNPKLLVLLSSAGILEPKSFKVKAKIVIFKLFKNLGFSRFREFFVADDAKKLPQHMYETFKKVIAEDFSDEFATRDGKTLLCWGKNDTATTLNSAKKINSLVKNSELVVYEGDHYFFLKHSEDIAKNVESRWN
jgi:pimeloyl-ACP methyl ester carboxylesterase